MTLGFGGFEDPAVICMWYGCKNGKKKKKYLKKEKKNFFKAHRLAAARILH